MKKYITIAILTIILFGTLIWNSITLIDYYNNDAVDAYNNLRNICIIDLDAGNEPRISDILCSELIETGIVKEEVQIYYENYDVKLLNTLERFGEYDKNDESFSVISGETILDGIVFIIMFVLSICSMWFVKDYLKKNKINKSNYKQIRNRSVLVSLIPAIPFVLYTIIEIIIPFIFVRRFITFTSESALMILYHLIVYITYAICASLIGLFSATFDDKKYKNYLYPFFILLFMTEGITLIMSLFADLFPNVFEYHFSFYVGWFCHDLVQVVVCLVITIALYLVFNKTWNKKNVVKTTRKMA